MQVKHGLLVSILILTVGCGGGTVSGVDSEIESGVADVGADTDNTDTENETTITEVETQQSLVTKYAGATFVSLETLEVGVTPTGVAMGNWKVSFTDDVVTWSYSDVIESGTYSLDSNASPIASVSGREIAFTGDGVSLTWDSRTYLRVDSSLFDSQQALVNYFDSTTYISVEELAIGENAQGGLAMDNWSISFDGNEIDWRVQDTVQVGTYSYADGSSFRVNFGTAQRIVYVLTGDRLLANSVMYKKDSIGQFDSQETLIEYLAGTTYQSATLKPIGPVTNGVVAVGNWFLDFSEDTFVWSYADIQEAGTYDYLSQSSFSAVLPNRILTIDIDAGDILWDGLRYIQQ